MSTTDVNQVHHNQGYILYQLVFTSPDGTERVQNVWSDCVDSDCPHCIPDISSSDD